MLCLCTTHPVFTLIGGRFQLSEAEKLKCPAGEVAACCEAAAFSTFSFVPFFFFG